MFVGTAKDSIFIRPSQPDQLYKLRDGIKFHLFINTAPCGDARIFSPHETEIGVDKHPNRLVSEKRNYHINFRIKMEKICSILFIIGKRVVSFAPR